MPLRVGPSGPRTAPICFIGEAPGADEVRQMRPFVGQAGMELTHLLMQAGISRSECYFTNVVKERPPSNDIKKFIDLSKKFPVHTKEYDQYELDLYKELSQLEANVYVPLGNIPLYALTRKRGILRQRGSILSASVIGKQIKVIPTIHPAALLPNRGKYIWRYFVLDDLHRILIESESPEVELPEYKLFLRPTFDESIEYIKECGKHDIVSFDIEVINEEVSCISFSTASNSSMSIPFIEDRDNYFSEEEELAIWKAVSDLLGDEKVRIITQNGCFDFSFLFKKYGIVVRPIEDTMVQHAILFPEFPKDLGFLTSIYTREPYYKSIGKDIFSERSAK